MRLLVVTQYQPFVEKINKQHGRRGATDTFVHWSETPAGVGDEDIECFEAFCSHQERKLFQ